ncbi:MAG: HAD family hydrolase [Prevotella sp.]|nr:HAD family hydrolase [Prevotella sp.]
MKGYKAYIFDLDGTLLDTLFDLAHSCNYALQACGLPRRTVEEVRQFVGNGVRVLMQKAVPEGEENPVFEEALDIFRQHYMLHGQEHTAPYPGIMDMLRWLRHEGKKIAVVSNKFDAATKQLCSHYFPGLVDVAIGESDGIRRKPAPDTVLTAMRLLGVEPHDSIYVGDSDTDILTAKNASIPCLSVTWGFRDRQFLIEHGATTLIASPEELP